MQVAVLGALVAYLVPIRGKAWDRSLAVADALALGCWTVAGTTKTLGVGMGIVAAVLLGITTAVGGGALKCSAAAGRGGLRRQHALCHRITCPAA